VAARALILVVDDEEPMRQLASLYLEKEGFQVACAADGPEAIELAHRQRPALRKARGVCRHRALHFPSELPAPRGAEKLPAGRPACRQAGTAPED